METAEVIIARLVLGYLKSEKCKSAYKEFLRTSSSLQGDATFGKSKYISTRFVGLTLEDILSEYFEIYKIVQGRLEATNYYNEFHSKTSLVQQLLYLLHKINSSRTSTPCPRSPLESNLDDTSPSHIDHVSDVETTPAHTLPGNVRCTSEDSYLHKSPKRQSQSRLSKSSTLNNLPDIDKEDMSEMLAQTLLENREFQEKIAQTINKVAEKQYKVSAELDKTIKTVVRETEEDPIFDKILEEIIGATTINDNNKEVQSISTMNSSGKDTNEDTVNRSKKTCNYSNSDSSVHRDQSSKSCLESQIVEEQNNEAISSIVANANLSKNFQGNSNSGTNNQDNVIAGQGNNEVIVFDGSLDKYLISNTCNATTQTQVVQNPLYVNNTGSLLMVPSNITTGNLHVDTSKQYYFVNKQSSMNWSIPKIKTPNVITEQDILAMPTVIVNDGVPTQSVLQTPVSTRVQKPIVTTILPKPTIEIPSSLGEYLTFYSAKEPQQNGLKKVIYPKKPKPRGTIVNASSTSDSTVTMTSIINSTNENKSLPTELLTEPSSKVAKENKSLPTDLLADLPSKDTALQTHEQELNKPQLSTNEHAPKTPAPPEQVQKVTPKSGSHVRNLDFSTPPKITSTHKKSIKSSQTHKTPLFVHKKQAAKALFPSQDTGSVNSDLKLKENNTECKMKTRKLTGAWDADLRSVITPAGDVKNQTPKRKRKSPLAKMKKKKTKKASKRVNPQLNTTVEDAAFLEAALKSPVKPDTDNSQVVDNSIKEHNKEDNKIKENICISERDKKKSNSSSKGTNEFQSKSNDIKSEKTVEPMHLEKAEDNMSKMILSPSKLNASKRNLLNTDIVPSDINKSELKMIDEKNKFITPETNKEAVQHPIKVNRNITPMLETPIKHKYVPKTPGLQTPINPSVDINISLSSSLFTPFSKMLEANLKGIDINSLPTPNIPITPNFPPFTPTVDLVSPYSNRPTDYSTSSSYYQPSDSEQNRSLEANLKEIEKKPIKVLSNEIIVPDSGDCIKIEKKNGKSHLVHPTIINEHLNIFNKNVIGKKNLNLMKRKSSSSSSSDDTTSNTSSEEEENSDSCQWNEKESNDTIIFNKKVTETPRRTYLLRNRSTVVKDKEELHKLPIATKDDKINKTPITKDKLLHSKGTSNTNSKQCRKESKPPSKPEKNVPRKAEKAKETSNTDVKEGSTKLEEINTLRQAVLRELEEKRLRVVNKIKNHENGSQKKSSCKPAVRQNAKFMKIKPIPNLTNSKRKPRKSDSPKKSLPNKSVKVSEKVFDNLKNDTDKSKTISCDGIFQDKSTSDVEAQNLIEGLKERGIHLMHNKSSPNKKLDINLVDSNLQDKICEQPESNDLSGDTANICNTTADINNSSELQKNELSTSHLESELRDTYDIRVFNDYECVVFDESKTITKTFEDYNTKVLEKKFIGKVFIEEIDEEIDVSMSFSPFYTLFDLQPTGDLSLKQDSKKANEKTFQEKKGMKKESVKNIDVGKEELSLTKDVIIPTASDELTKSDDDLMNYAVVGSLREENPEGSESPKSTRKRKLWNEGSSHTEKKCKTLLKQINVESFLNNIHGGS